MEFWPETGDWDLDAETKTTSPAGMVDRHRGHMLRFIYLTKAVM